MKIYMSYGLLGASSYILGVLIFFYTGVDRWDNYRNFIILDILFLVFWIYLGITKQKNAEPNRYIRYESAFRTGFLITLVQSFVGAIFLFFHLKWINPGFNDFILQNQIKELHKKGFGEAQLESGIQIQKFLIGPVSTPVTNFISFLIMGTIVSLILAAVLKNENPVNLN